MPELNPVTRKRLWYICAFLAVDAIVALYTSAAVNPADPIALPAIAFGLISGVGAGSLGAFLIATGYVPADMMKKERVRE